MELWIVTMVELTWTAKDLWIADYWRLYFWKESCMKVYFGNHCHSKVKFHKTETICKPKIWMNKFFFGAWRLIILRMHYLTMAQMYQNFSNFFRWIWMHRWSKDFWTLSLAISSTESCKSRHLDKIPGNILQVVKVGNKFHSEHSHIKSRYLRSPAFSTRGVGFVILLSPLLLYLLNDPADKNIPNLWNIALQDVVNGQEPACVPTQSKTCVTMKGQFSMISYYNAKKETTDRKERYARCLLFCCCCCSHALGKQS